MMLCLRLFLIIAFVLPVKLLFAQGVVPAWAYCADQKDFSAGFTFQIVSTSFKIDKKPDWRTPFYDPISGVKLTDSLQSISSNSSPGFAIGFLGRYRLSDHVEARLTPTVVFCDRLLGYEYKDATGNPLLSQSTANPGNKLEQQIQITMWDIPVSLKIKSDRLGNFRAYMLGGLKYSLLISSTKDDPKIAPIDMHVKNVKGFASYEVGFGCDIYFEYFKLSPEIKISNSFKNILVAENNPYSRPLDKLFLRQIMFTFYFE